VHIRLLIAFPHKKNGLSNPHNPAATTLGCPHSAPLAPTRTRKTPLRIPQSNPQSRREPSKPQRPGRAFQLGGYNATHGKSFLQTRVRSSTNPTKENRKEIAVQLNGVLQELAKEPFYAKLVLTCESMRERPELSFETKVPGQPYIKEIEAICARYVDSRPPDGEYRTQKAKAKWRMAEIRRREAEGWK
jgi:hypothetical protein